MSTEEERYRQELEEIYEARSNRFRVLVCIDGSDEGYLGLKYADRMGGHREDCDIILLYVRPTDQGLHSGGLQVRVARENMLSWGLELPGIRRLKKGLELLVGAEELEKEWVSKTTSTGVEGDPLGDNKIEYRHASGRTIVLKLKVAPDAASGILDQYELGPYNMIIMGSAKQGRGRVRATLSPSVSEKVAYHAPCSVLLVRDLVAGQGHLVGVDGSDFSKEIARQEAILAARFPDPKLSAVCVAEDDEGVPQAESIVAEIAQLLKDELGFNLKGTYVRVGDPVEQIVEAGKDYSVIVLGDSGKGTMSRILGGGVSTDVMRLAHNSVLIMR
ncbi:MAG: universal stress protein [Rhodospirillaceae bacterium]|nr:universal stress protein [Rhodospirillaceae bacterium]